MASYRIPPGGVTEGQRQGDLRTFVPTKIIRYYVDGHGPFTYTIDAADFTPDRVAADLEKAAADVRKLYGG